MCPVAAGSAKPAGVAVDWVADNLYWTQVDRSGSKPRGAVVTSTTDGRYKRTLIATREFRTPAKVCHTLARE